MYLAPTMSIFSFFLKKILLIHVFIFLFNNYLIANKIERTSSKDAGFSEDRLTKIDKTFIKLSVKLTRLFPLLVTPDEQKAYAFSLAKVMYRSCSSKL